MTDDGQASWLRSRGTVLLTVVLLAAIAFAGIRWLRPTVPPADRTDPEIVHRVDVNRAEAAEIAALPGIGAALAGRIVEDRDRHGPFRRVEDVERVRGIGPRTVERIRPHVVCGPETP